MTKDVAISLGAPLGDREGFSFSTAPPFLGQEKLAEEIPCHPLFGGEAAGTFPKTLEDIHVHQWLRTEDHGRLSATSSHLSPLSLEATGTFRNVIKFSRNLGQLLGFLSLLKKNFEGNLSVPSRVTCTISLIDAAFPCGLLVASRAI